MLSFLNSQITVILLVVLVLVEGVFIYKLYKANNEYRCKGDDIDQKSDYPKDADLNRAYEQEKLNTCQIQSEYEKLLEEYRRYKNETDKKIEEIVRLNNELNMLVGNRMQNSSSQNNKTSAASADTKYASFPRVAGGCVYFSDLSAGKVEDSYFELKISNDKATFRPLDFLRIRNFDSAMAAMCTTGVKPHVASTVIGVEPGQAHLEGKDWIIDKPANIKLA